MSNRPHNTSDHARFDLALQGHHAAALAQLSPQVRAELAKRRIAANRTEGARSRHGVRYAAAAFATLCALAIGLQLRPATLPGHVASADATIAIVAAAGRSDSTMLDEDPEFYAWLASSDAQQIAME